MYLVNKDDYKTRQIIKHWFLPVCLSLRWWFYAYRPWWWLIVSVVFLLAVVMVGRLSDSGRSSTNDMHVSLRRGRYEYPRRLYPTQLVALAQSRARAAISSSRACYSPIPLRRRVRVSLGRGCRQCESVRGVVTRRRRKAVRKQEWSVHPSPPATGWWFTWRHVTADAANYRSLIARLQNSLEHTSISASPPQRTFNIRLYMVYRYAHEWQCDIMWVSK